jgi:pantetheine-phosphate adenylyltransferase
MPVALYPGTFDPITHGHVDIARRAAGIFTRVIAVVAVNPNKKTLFSADERVAMATTALADVDNIEVVRYDGLIVNCMRDSKATLIIRGLRALSDFDYEFQMAFTNRNMNAAAETVFLMPSAEYIYLNSSMVKQIAGLGGDVSSFVPPVVEQALRQKLQGKPK